VPQEILEDSKFVAINNEDPRFGPAVSKLHFTANGCLECLSHLSNVRFNVFQGSSCMLEIEVGHF
jgi:hypothetical protein